MRPSYYCCDILVKNYQERTTFPNISEEASKLKPQLQREQHTASDLYVFFIEKSNKSIVKLSHMKIHPSIMKSTLVRHSTGNLLDGGRKILSAILAFKTEDNVFPHTD